MDTLGVMKDKVVGKLLVKQFLVMDQISEAVYQIRWKSQHKSEDLKKKSESDEEVGKLGSDFRNPYPCVYHQNIHFPP